jgi:hypothetical protein
MGVLCWCRSGVVFVVVLLDACQNEDYWRKKYWENSTTWKKAWQSYEAMHECTRLYLAIVLCGWFFVHPSLMSQFFSLFACQDLTTTSRTFAGWSQFSRSFLIADLEISCGSANHMLMYELKVWCLMFFSALEWSLDMPSKNAHSPQTHTGVHNCF